MSIQRTGQRWCRVGADVPFVLILLLFWLLNHPYRGIWGHDARIYSALALSRISPESFTADPFFQANLQEQLSLFSAAYAGLVKWMGLPDAARVVTLTGVALWTVSLWLLSAQATADRRLRLFYALCGVCLSLSYAPYASTFELNEAFATARILAIPLATLAVALAIGGRLASGLAAAAAATLLHPLFGIWSLALIIMQRLDKRWLVGMVALGVAGLAGGILLGWPALAPMGEPWLGLVRQSTVDVLVGDLSSLRWDRWLFWTGALVVGARFGSPSLRRWYALTVFLVAGGFLAAAVSGHFYPARLLVQAQLWRGLWLAIVVGGLALVDVGRIAWTTRPDLRPCWMALPILAYLTPLGCGILLTLAGLGLRGRHLSLADQAVLAFVQRFPRLTWVAVGGLALVAAPSYLIDLAIAGDSLAGDAWHLAPMLSGLLIAGGWGLGALLVATAAARMRWGVLRTALLAVAVAWMGVRWLAPVELPAQWERYVAAGPPGALEGSPVHRGETVLWLQNPHRVWLELRTASYASATQIIGLAMSEERALELRRRLFRVAAASRLQQWPAAESEVYLALQDFRRTHSLPPNRDGSLFSYEPQVLTDAGVRYLCEDAALDWIVVPATTVAVGAGAQRVVDRWSGGRFDFLACKQRPSQP